MAKYFKTPFAASGNRAVTPDAIQPNGSVSYTEGFPIAYELDLATDENAKAIPRTNFNGLQYDITQAIGSIQRWTYPEWITSASNGGTPVVYPSGARVIYNGQTYEAIVNNATALPTDKTQWRLVTGVYQTALAVADSQSNPNILILSSRNYFVAELSSLILALPVLANTGPVKISFNGETPVDLLANGRQLVAGEVGPYQMMLITYFWISPTEHSYALLNPIPIPIVIPPFPPIPVVRRAAPAAVGYTGGSKKYTFYHGFSNVPDSIMIYAECTSSEGGYITGEFLSIPASDFNGLNLSDGVGTDTGYSTLATLTDFSIYVRSTGIRLHQNTGDGFFTMSPNKWRFWARMTILS